MWQPGESKPEAASDHMDTVELGEAKEKGMDTTNKNALGGNLQKTPPSSSKKLSGATMNMRFMQRMAEQKQQEAKRRRSTGDNMAVDQAVSPKRPQHTNDGGGDDVDDDMSDDEDDDDETFQIAGSADMYGPQANVLGRRSFGGFNRPMEEAWKSFHQSQSSFDNKKPKVSDDELLKRYEDYVKNGRRREDAKRPIGNLQNKQKRKAKSPADAKKANKRPAQR
jgi:hypothetical protein